MTTRPERFGLTLIEAMACGTPVLGADMGSIPEIVVDGHTGFLCTTVDDAAAHVPQLAELDRAACRKHVEATFSTDRMIERYCAAYIEALRLGQPAAPREAQRIWRVHDWWDRPMAFTDIPAKPLHPAFTP
jgi:glycosyltransferase involved in cell wall biosynthesis